MVVNIKLTRVSASTRLMMGMAYDRITTLGLQYIARGSITKDELEELQKYFYEPYKALGGNGVAERVMAQVLNLPLRTHEHYAEIFRNSEHERYYHNVPVIARPDGQEVASF